MLTILMSFGVGLFAGIILTALILRNNSKLADTLADTKK